MRKGSTVTEDQVRWSDISAAAWKSARDAAMAMAANGRPMSDESVETRARNIQDREDLRTHCNGGMLSGSTYRDMSRGELVAAINEQLQAGLYGAGSKNGFKKVRQIRAAREEADRQMPSKYAGKCDRCSAAVTVGETIFWNPQWRTVTCTACH